MPAAGYAYEKQKRKIGDYATAAAAVLLVKDGDTCTSASIAMTNLSDTPIYSEAAGAALVGTIATGERVYYAQHSNYVAIAATNECGSMDLDGDGNPGDIDVDARMNTYFRNFQVTAAGGGFVAATTGER